MMKLKELIGDMNRLESVLMRHEKHFGIKSAEFYQAISSGELDEFDAFDEYRMDFIEWLALYKTWMSLNESYRQLIKRQPVAIQIRSALAAA
jgi:hypothetical protein